MIKSNTDSLRSQLTYGKKSNTVYNCLTLGCKTGLGDHIKMSEIKAVVSGILKTDRTILRMTA